MEEEQETCRSMTPTAGIFTLNITGKTLRQNALFAKSYLVFQYLRMSSRFGFTTSISMTAVSEWTSILQKKAIEIDGIIKGRLFEQAKELTGLDNPKSTAQLKGWIEDTAGIEVESLNKKSIAGVRAEADNKKVDAMLDIRAGLSKTSTEKYNAMLRTACADGRIRGLTQFYGASRTGRWAGRLVQMQNLPQNKMPDRDLDTARQLVAKGDLETLELLFDDISGTLSQLIRTAFVPKKGCRFIVADFSAIEARVLAWLANEEWRMDVFNTHGKNL